jgi:hypothetical protein
VGKVFEIQQMKTVIFKPHFITKNGQPISGQDTCKPIEQ